MTIAADPRYRSVGLQWTNNEQTGTEIVQVLAKALGGGWGLVRSVAVTGDSEQAASWDTAAPVTSYALAMRYMNGVTPATGYESDDPDLWTAPTAAGSKGAVVTTAAPVAWAGGSFVDAATPINLSWTSAQQGGCYLLEKSVDAGVTWTNVAVDLVANNYAYVIPGGELGHTTRFRLTAQRGAVVGPSAGTRDVDMFLSVGIPTWISAIFDPNAASIALSWNPATSATSYQIQESTNGGATYGTIATQAGTTYTRNLVAANQLNFTFHYKIVALNGAFAGVPSADQPVTTTVTLPAATITALTDLGPIGPGGSHRIQIDFTLVGGNVAADDVEIFLSEDGGASYHIGGTIRPAVSPGVTNSVGVTFHGTLFVKIQPRKAYTAFGEYGGALSAPDTIVIP